MAEIREDYFRYARIGVNLIFCALIVFCLYKAIVWVAIFNGTLLLLFAINYDTIMNVVEKFGWIKRERTDRKR